MATSRDLQPPESESAPTAARLLEVAAELFGRHGYQQTTTREIADRLQLQKGSLYYHIKNKEELLYRICVESLRRMEEQVGRHLIGVPAADRLRVLIRAHVAAALQDRAMHAVMLTELRSLSPESRADVVIRRDQYQRTVFEVVSAAQAAGQLRAEIDAKLLTLSLLDLLNWTIFWFRPDGPLQPSELAEALGEIFLNGAGGRGNGGPSLLPLPAA